MRCSMTGLPIVLAALCAAPAAAVDVYHWVDENGVAHYSQWEPVGAARGVETVTLNDAATAGVGGDVYPIEELSESMEALWAEIEKQRAERAAQARARPPPAIIYPPQPTVGMLWPGWPADRPHRPRPPGRPERPVEPAPAPGPLPSAPLRPPGRTP